MRFSNQNRNKYIEELSSENFDVLIIGGGITGAGIAFDAALRGMKVGLVEMQDFAAGTSSRSTKLIHGGLRYLKQFEMGLVAEVGKEREIVYKNGPHVTTPQWMLLPIYKDTEYGLYSTSIGLKIYDYLARVKMNERRKMLSRQECLEKSPHLRRQGLLGGGYYVEYRTDDARLTIEVLKAAHSNGAILLNYMKVESFQYNGSGKINGATVMDQLTGKTYFISSKMVVNATGPWVDIICERDGSSKEKNLQLTKGAHLVFDQSVFPLEQAVYFDTPDGRMVFAIPREGKTYVGTTDTFYNENPISPMVTREDRGYLLKYINYMFPNLMLTDKNIESSWAGVRPLLLEEGKEPSEISRRDEIWESHTGLITIAGGKLTGYRKMAEMVVDLISQRLKHRTFKPCETAKTPISGGDVGEASQFQAFVSRKSLEGVKVGLSMDEAKELASTYGSNVTNLFQYIEDNKGKNASLPDILRAKLQYALDHEMIVTPLDFFNRRTGFLYFNLSLVEKYQTGVIQYMADYFQWNEDRMHRYTEELNLAIKNAQVTIQNQLSQLDKKEEIN
ncbi:glycerol-3-phosphate dehydrogenase/oxidase [Niallia sp. Krafla_26]|uniref:glycerol-3-phosphate dehydrogenase/oxidase n=1 Tax=Niallia sp. Krafla_26 TaxID=3064703 RepID=UPI003D17AD83